MLASDSCVRKSSAFFNGKVVLHKAKLPLTIGIFSKNLVSD